MKATVSQIYTTSKVTSTDGTLIGYRQFGHGPGVVLVHGGMQASQNFMKLADSLSDTFTVYVPDRRGRGLSGPFGDNYSIKKECEDLAALLEKTSAHYVFGLSSGALVAMQAALSLPVIQKVALYEPPLSVDGSSLTLWLARYDKEVAKGDLAAAFITVINETGIEDPPILFKVLPRFVLASFMRPAIRAQARKTQGDDVPLEALIPTMHYDAHLANDLKGALYTFKDMRSEVLLLGGSKTQGYLRAALDALQNVLPHIRRIEFPGVGHLVADNDGKPELVAEQLRRFFGPPDEGLAT